MTDRLSTLTGGTSRRTQLIALAVVVAIAALLGYNVLARPASASPAFPTSAEMEQQFGIRFSRIALVGDGGLIQVSYVILDSDKATRFQDDRDNLPALKNEESGGTTKRVALMKQGHSLPVGQTYYFVYNNAGTVSPHDHATLTSHGLSLTGIEVQ